MGRSRRALTRSSSSAHGRLTWLLDTPLIPSALTRSSTERVDTPCTQASRMTAASAFSASSASVMMGAVIMESPSIKVDGSHLSLIRDHDDHPSRDGRRRAASR